MDQLGNPWSSLELGQDWSFVTKGAFLAELSGTGADLVVGNWSRLEWSQFLIFILEGPG